MVVNFADIKYGIFLIFMRRERSAQLYNMNPNKDVANNNGGKQPLIVKSFRLLELRCKENYMILLKTNYQLLPIIIIRFI